MSFTSGSLDADLALAIVRRLQIEVRPDLKLLVMSATLDPAPIARFLGDCPRIEASGRLHPVAISYLRHDDRSPIHVQVAGGVRQIASQTAGDVLAFLPGVGEIRRTARELEAFAAENNLALMELYGDLAARRAAGRASTGRSPQDRAGDKRRRDERHDRRDHGRRRFGLARINRLDPALGINRLDVSRDLASVGRSARRPSGTNRAGRLPAALDRSDAAGAGRA